MSAERRSSNIPFPIRILEAGAALRLPSRALHVLGVLAIHARYFPDDPQTSTRVSVPRILNLTGLSRAGIYRGLGELQIAGLVDRVGREWILTVDTGNVDTLSHGETKPSHCETSVDRLGSHCETGLSHRETECLTVRPEQGGTVREPPDPPTPNGVEVSPAGERETCRECDKAMPTPTVSGLCKGCSWRHAALLDWHDDAGEDRGFYVSGPDIDLPPLTEHTIWADDLDYEVYGWATERHKNRVKAADDRRPMVEGDVEDSYAIAAQANRNRRERVEVETRTRADLLKVCREARFTLLMLTPEDFNLLADTYAMKPATDAAARADAEHLDRDGKIQTRHYEELYEALRAGKRTAILSWITRTRAVDWDAEVKRAIALDTANEATKDTPAAIPTAAKMPDISGAEQAGLPLTGTYEQPETGPGLDPVEMRIAAACEAAEELGWETSDNGRTWRNPKMPAAVLEMVIEGNVFKMIPAKTTSTTTQPADPIPQATAPAEPRRGVVACDNSQEQEDEPMKIQPAPGYERGDSPHRCYVCDGETDSPALHPMPHREGVNGGPLSVPVCPACSLRVVGRGLAALRKGGQPVMVGWPDDVRFEPAPPMTEQEITANRAGIVWGLLVDARAERDEAAA